MATDGVVLTLIEPPLHPARPCACGRSSTALVRGRCLPCRTPEPQRSLYAALDVARHDRFDRERWCPPEQAPEPHRAPPANVCSACDRAVHGLAEGRCLSCRVLDRPAGQDPVDRSEAEATW